MKLTEFTPDVAKRVMELWKTHLGLCPGWNSQKYYEHPDLLVVMVINSRNWVTGRFEEPIGSKWTDNSKLLVYNRYREGVHIEAYVDLPTYMECPEAGKKEEEFNRDVMAYVACVGRTS